MGCNQSKSTNEKKPVQKQEEVPPKANEPAPAAEATPVATTAAVDTTTTKDDKPETATTPAVPAPEEVQQADEAVASVPAGNEPVTLKIVVMGNPGVGKTCILSQYVLSKFNKAHSPTRSPNVLTKTIDVDGRAVTLQLFDMGGIDSNTPPEMDERMVCKGADGFVVVYDVNTLETFGDALLISVRLGGSYGTNGVAPSILLLGNKGDLDDENRKVYIRDGKKAADEFDVIYNEVSAAYHFNIDHVFHMLAADILAKR